MGTRPTILDRLFSARDALEDAHPVLEMLKGLNINQVSRRATMFRDENGILLLVEGGEDASGLSLKRCDQFCFHK